MTLLQFDFVRYVIYNALNEFSRVKRCKTNPNEQTNELKPKPETVKEHEEKKTQTPLWTFLQRKKIGPKFMCWCSRRLGRYFGIKCDFIVGEQWCALSKMGLSNKRFSHLFFSLCFSLSRSGIQHLPPSDQILCIQVEQYKIRTRLHVKILHCYMKKNRNWFCKME